MESNAENLVVKSKQQQKSDCWSQKSTEQMQQQSSIASAIEHLPEEEEEEEEETDPLHSISIEVPLLKSQPRNNEKIIKSTQSVVGGGGRVSPESQV